MNGSEKQIKFANDLINTFINGKTFEQVWNKPIIGLKEHIKNNENAIIEAREEIANLDKSESDYDEEFEYQTKKIKKCEDRLNLMRPLMGLENYSGDAKKIIEQMYEIGLNCWKSLNRGGMGIPQFNDYDYNALLKLAQEK